MTANHSYAIASLPTPDPFPLCCYGLHLNLSDGSQEPNLQFAHHGSIRRLSRIKTHPTSSQKCAIPHKHPAHKEPLHQPLRLQQAHRHQLQHRRYQQGSSRRQQPNAHNLTSSNSLRASYCATHEATHIRAQASKIEQRVEDQIRKQSST
jgi:hypothetical protein